MPVQRSATGIAWHALLALVILVKLILNPGLPFVSFQQIPFLRLNSRWRHLKNVDQKITAPIGYDGNLFEILKPVFFRAAKTAISRPAVEIFLY